MNEEIYPVSQLCNIYKGSNAFSERSKRRRGNQRL